MDGVGTVGQVGHREVEAPAALKMRAPSMWIRRPWRWARSARSRMTWGAPGHATAPVWVFSVQMMAGLREWVVTGADVWLDVGWGEPAGV